MKEQFQFRFHRGEGNWIGPFDNYAIIGGKVAAYTEWKRGKINSDEGTFYFGKQKLGEGKWAFSRSSDGHYRGGEVTSISSQLTPSEYDAVRKFIRKKNIKVVNDQEKKLTHSGRNQKKIEKNFPKHGCLSYFNELPASQRSKAHSK